MDFASRKMETKEALRKGVMEKDISQKELQKIIKSLDSNMSLDLIILRGLFSYDIINHSLTKRWSVDYGINKLNKKKNFVVPFKAKDTASERTEFGHPDVALVLTHISYYSQGLTREQIKFIFEKLKSDKSSHAEYDSWVKIDKKIPKYLQNYSSLNVSDMTQILGILLLK